MRFGFNFASDEAKGALDRLRIQWTVKDGQFTVDTAAYDMKIQIMREKEDIYNIILPDTKDMKKEQRSDGSRVLKDEIGRYWYLWNDTVFKMKPKIVLDYTVTPPTQFVITVLELEEDNDRAASMRDRLISRPPNADIEGGGVLI